MQYLNGSNTKQIIHSIVSQALVMTRNEIFEVISSHINDYYSEPVFRGLSEPKEYERTYQFMDSLIKTDVKLYNNELYCTVEIDRNYLDYTYSGGATGYNVYEWANACLHGGTVHGAIRFWNNALDELGNESGIKTMLLNNLKRCGL